MSQVNRRKAYKSRRERSNKHWRNIRLVALFGLIALAIVIFMNRRPILRWIGTYFY